MWYSSTEKRITKNMIILHHKTYETNRFFDNWFVNIAGGINVYEGEYDHKVTLGNRLSPALDISVGKWITPAYESWASISGRSRLKVSQLLKVGMPKSNP